MNFDLMTGLSIILAFSAVVAGILAVVHKNLVVTIIAAGVVSLIASIIFLLLAAPDVAMTEAAIGSGLSTIIFFYALNRVRKGGENG